MKEMLNKILTNTISVVSSYADIVTLNQNALFDASVGEDKNDTIDK